MVSAAAEGVHLRQGAPTEAPARHGLNPGRMSQGVQNHAGQAVTEAGNIPVIRVRIEIMIMKAYHSSQNSIIQKDHNIMTRVRQGIMLTT